MHIGIITNYYVPEFGMNTYYLCRGLARLGVDVTLFASSRYGRKNPKEKFSVNEIEQPFTVIKLPTLLSIANVPIMPTLMRELTRYDFDLLQTEDAYQIYSYASALVSKIKHIPLILRHDLSLPPSEPLYGSLFRLVEETVSKQILKNTDLAIAATPAAEKYLHHLKPDLRVEVVPFGVDTEQFRPIKDVYPSTLGFDPATKGFTILTIARLVKSKGLHDLFYAVTKLKRVVPRINLILVGKGPLESELKKLARQLGVANVIHFIDFVRHDRIHLWYNYCDVFMLPSYEEAGALTILEAMACGKPVISSNISGIRGSIDDGVNGILIKPGDRMALFEAMLKIYHCPDLAHEWGSKARQKVVANFSWEVICKKMKELYSKILQSR